MGSQDLGEAKRSEDPSIKDLTSAHEACKGKGGRLGSNLVIKGILQQINHKSRNSRYLIYTKTKLLQLYKRKCLKRAVVNLTRYPINKSIANVLQRGIKFVPTLLKGKKDSVDNGFVRLRRRMYLDYFFAHHISNNKHHPFKGPSNWQPPMPSNSNVVKYLNNIKRRTHNHIENTPIVPGNFTKLENHVLKEITSNTHWVVKPADKGGALVIWGREAYLEEAERQLGDKIFYEVCDIDYTSLLARELFVFLESSCKLGVIDEITKDLLKPPQPICTPIFYLLPKIHKLKITGWPTISGCNSPTKNLAKFVDYFLQPLVPQLKSYLKDTNYFPKSVLSLNHTFPEGTLLVTLDVKSLYTNISQDEAIEVCCKAFHFSLQGLTNLLFGFSKKCLNYILT